MNKILCVTPNYNTAADIKTRAFSTSYEFCVVTKGVEALDFLKREEKVLLLLVETSITDVAIGEIIETSRKYHKNAPVFVLIDKTSNANLQDYCNRYKVSKIYASPYEIDVITENVKQIADNTNTTVNNNEANDTAVDGNGDTDDRDEIDKTIRNLTEALKKQQKSYSKLEPIFSTFTRILCEDFKDIPGFEKKVPFANDIFDTMMRMQTTGSYDIDKFEDQIKDDLKTLSNKYKGITVGNVNSCLFGGVAKTLAENIRFSVWAIARYYAEFYEGFTYDVSSHFLTPTEAEFSCHVVLPDSVTIEEIDAKSGMRSEYREFVFSLIEKLSTEARREGDKKDIMIIYSFPVAD